MTVVLYWQAISHPSQAARKMLDLKRVEYKPVDVLPLNQRIHLRLAGFRRGTVPALKLDGRKIQGSRAIARELDARWPDPPLFPADPESRARVEEAERWGEEHLQPIPRRLFRYGVATDPKLRQRVVRGQGLPFPRLVAAAMQPLVAYYARTVEADGRRGTETDVRADLAALPEMLAVVDRLLDDGILSLEPPNAAALQILTTVRVLDAFADLRATVRAHPCSEAAQALFPDYPAELPRFLPAEWLSSLPATARLGDGTSALI
jgi:glutathione S-transferase